MRGGKEKRIILRITSNTKETCKGFGLLKNVVRTHTIALIKERYGKK